MDMNLIVSILLDYYWDTWRWTTARALNTRSKSLVDLRKVSDDCYGSFSFLKMHWCSVCHKNCKDETWLRYVGDEMAHTRWISHCNTWKCRVSALKSMISDYKEKNVHVLRVPIHLDDDIDIPRSDGSFSKGTYRKGVVIHRDGQYYISAHWRVGMEEYSKLVPLSYYTNEKPKLMFN